MTKKLLFFFFFFFFLELDVNRTCDARSILKQICRRMKMLNMIWYERKVPN